MYSTIDYNFLLFKRKARRNLHNNILPCDVDKIYIFKPSIQDLYNFLKIYPYNKYMGFDHCLFNYARNQLNNYVLCFNNLIILDIII